MPDNKKGTQEFKDLIDLALALVEAGLEVSADKKIDVTDLAAIMKVIPLVGPAVEHIGDIPSELGDLDADEAGELVAHVMGRLAIDNAKAALVVNKSLKTILAVFELFKAIKA